MPQAVCIGEGLVVLSGRDHPSLDQAELLSRSVGGAEVNVALGLATLGIGVAWGSRVGDDPFGRVLTRTLAAAGVDVSGVEIDPVRPTGIYFKDQVDGRSHRHYRRAGSAATTLDAAYLDGLAALSASDLVHTGGILPAVLDRPEDFVDALLAARSRHRFALSVDLNWRPELWHRRDREPLHRLLRNADVVFAGRDETELVWGTSAHDTLRARVGDATLVIKDDANDAVEVAPDGSTTAVPALPARVVEATGAGDGFAAGYLAARLRGAPARERLEAGHRQAAAVLSTTGDHAPTPNERGAVPGPGGPA